eukprot:10313811-Ditylum_brightwellii.AAC.1
MAPYIVWEIHQGLISYAILILENDKAKGATKGSSLDKENNQTHMGDSQSLMESKKSHTSSFGKDMERHHNTKSFVAPNST